ncbi:MULTISPECIES: hypothetical protein [unclassified Aureispira]|uniref:hypothetical protein n=1 Tax=unclassified Aureispira TaxID=2649989 RepID=UPI000698D10E|nr:MULTISPECIES: hypothetical protein [unclassified Aureispira]WMX14874.1 hypothetical protein QP953_00650 [Aureispira sp. CCB-E]
MKKAIFFNLFISIAWIPYAMQRWLEMPYSEGVWSSEVIIIYVAFFIAVGLAISNTLLIFTYKSIKYKRIFAKLTMIHLAGLLLYPIYSGIVIASTGNIAWVDILAIGILYGNLWLMNQAYQKIIA